MTLLETALDKDVRDRLAILFYTTTLIFGLPNRKEKQANRSLCVFADGEKHAQLRIEACCSCLAELILTVVHKYNLICLFVCLKLIERYRKMFCAIALEECSIKSSSTHIPNNNNSIFPSKIVRSCNFRTMMRKFQRCA